MKGILKRTVFICSFILALTLCFCFSAGALDATGECGGGVTYTFNSSTGELVISGEGVIKEGAFEDCEEIKSVIIGDGVTGIAGSAFEFCSSIKSISLGKGITFIGQWAFSGCENLEKVYTSDLESWIKIEFSETAANPLIFATELYFGNSLVTEVAFPEGTKSIKKHAFYNYSNLTAVTIPDTVETISEYAFYNCENLKSVNIPDSVVSIGAYAFCGCEGIESVTIPGNVKELGEWSFARCAFDELILENGITEIGESAFYNCYSIKELTVPESVTSLGDGCFDSCFSLNVLNILNPDLNIAGASFGENLVICCYKNSEAHSFAQKNNMLFVLFDGNDEESIISNTVGAFNWTIDKRTGVLELQGSGKMVDFASANAPWYECGYYITSIKLPSGLTIIGENAFKDLFRVKSVNIPDSVKEIKDSAFRGCTELDSVVFPDGLTYIGEDAFNECESLTSIIVPDSVTTLEGYAFKSCISLTDAVIGSGVTEIGNCLFKDCSELKNITIGDAVSYIGSDAFFNTAIEKMTIPYTVEEIGARAFGDCKNLKEITIYSTDCVISLDCGINYNHTVYGFLDSTAEDFCEEVGARFVDVETVHSHNYVSSDKKGYCTYAKCFCGKENAREHNDDDKNALCDNCGTSVNDIDVGGSLTFVRGEDDRELYLCFTAPQEGTYTLTADRDFDGFMEILEKISADSYHRLELSHSASVSYNLTAGQKVYWRICIEETATLTFTLSYNETHIHAVNQTVTVDPTCTTNGSITYICSCGLTETRTIPASGHSYTSWYITGYGSCTSPFALRRDCKNCDTGYDAVTIPAVGKHSEEKIVIPATENTDGKVITICSACGEKIKTETVSKIASVSLSATKYTYDAKSKTPSVTVKDSKGNILKKDTDYTVSYASGRKSIGKYSVTVQFKGKYAGAEKLSFTVVPAAPGSFAYSASSTSVIKLSWKAVTGATGYRIYRYNSSSKKYERLATVFGKTSYSVTSLKAGTAYKFKVRAFTEVNDDELIWGGYSSSLEGTTKPSAPKISKLTTTKGKATFTWSNISGESGYQVYYSTKKSSDYKKLGTYKANVVTASKSKLTSSKTYYFKVRAYKTVAGKTVYSDWSAVKSIKIK